MSFDEAYVNIDTPENVAFNYEIAGLGSRFIAALVDSLIIVLTLGVLYAVVLGSINLTRFTLGLGDLAATWSLAFLVLMSFLILWGYYVLFETLWNGRTLGKRWAKLQVVRLDGAPIGLTESIIRNVVRLVDFLPFSYGIGVIAMFLDPQSRRLGDFAAGTLVVLDQAQDLTLHTLTRSPFAPSRLQGPARAEALPVERLSDAEMQLVRDFLSRQFELGNPRAIGQQLVVRAFQSMGVSLERVSQRPPEEWLQMIYLLRMQRLEEE